MLTIGFTFEPKNSASARQLLDGKRFIGDVFRGWFNRFMRAEYPVQWSALRGELVNSVAGPAYSISLGMLPGYKIRARIVLFGSAVQQLNDVIGALTRHQLVELGPPATQFLLSNWQVGTPGCMSRALVDSETGLVEALPKFLIDTYSQTTLPLVTSRETSDPPRLSFRLTSPLVLGEYDEARPPFFVQIVKALAKRLRDLEPKTADLIGINSLAWFELERKLKNVQPAIHRLKAVSWTYRSENQASHRRRGIVGDLHFDCGLNHQDLLVPSLAWLLWLGQWLGIGQNTAGGQGQYTLTSNFLVLPKHSLHE